MNFNKILHEIEKSDPEVYDRLSDRRQALASFGKKVAIAALPIALGSLFNKAYGKSTDTVISVLNYALELEYFEYNFYHSGMATGNNTTGTLIVAADRPGFQMVEDQEMAHINFLRGVINTMGGTPFTPHNYTRDPLTGDPYSPASYDFTGGNVYATYTSYVVYLQMAQAFEDAGIRAYIDQVPNLVANTNGILSQIMQISAVEGRHASFIRLVRRFAGAVDYPKPWVTNNVPSDIPFQPFYLGEDNTVQKGVQITGLPGLTGTISTTAATEAFDEPIDKPTMLSLMSQFLL